MTPKILAIIPARGGSKGIPRKNIVTCAGQPLLCWTVNAALNSHLITDTILSSDDEEIISVAKECGVRVPYVRPKELSKDDTPALPVIWHAVEWVMENDNYQPDIIVLLQPTSPLRLSHHIDEALHTLLESPEADSIVSVTEVPHQYSPTSVMLSDGPYVVPLQSRDESLNLRQLKPIFYARNGAAIYAFRVDCLLEKNSIYGDRVLRYYMAPEESVDIDTLFDLKVAEMQLQTRRKNNKKQ